MLCLYTETYRIGHMDNTTDLIKRLRASGLSQSEIARRTGIPQPRISRWESGGTPSSVDDALRLLTLANKVLAPKKKPKPVEVIA